MTNIIFNRDEQYWLDHTALTTAREIRQQPRLWRVLADELSARKDEIIAFMQQFENKDIRIAFTGAGSSAFIGESLQKILAKEQRLDTVTIHSPDVIAYPEGELFNVPTLLVSFARSGESPESVAAIQKAQAYVDELYNLVIVCKRGSSLEVYGSAQKDSLVLVMPEGSSDQGFAMTSSVSCMMLAAYVCFSYTDFDERIAFIRQLADIVDEEFDELDAKAGQVAAADYERCIFIGLGGLKGLAHEGSIKTMELTNGGVITEYEGTTGFRHGPKTVINDETITVHLISADDYTREYDLDFLREVINERKGNKILAILPERYGDLAGGSDFVITYKTSSGRYSEMESYISSLMVIQLLSLEKSIALGNTTDSPCAGGEVNRVVKGVIIH